MPLHLLRLSKRRQPNKNVKYIPVKQINCRHNSVIKAQHQRQILISCYNLLSYYLKTLSPDQNDQGFRRQIDNESAISSANGLASNWEKPEPAIIQYIDT